MLFKIFMSPPVPWQWWGLICSLRQFQLPPASPPSPGSPSNSRCLKVYTSISKAAAKGELSESCEDPQGSQLELARDDFEGKLSHGCVSWGVIVTIATPSPLEPYFLPGVLQKADRPINFTSLLLDDFSCCWFWEILPHRCFQHAAVLIPRRLYYSCPC